MRIWLHTPVLHSASSIHDNLHLAQRAVDLAKETIHYLNRLNSQTNLYRKIQVFYHQFLTSAIAVLFLASTHAPMQFSASCRNEFYMALELVRDMSVKSFVSQRLWRTISSLKNYASRLGLAEDEDQSNAALTMARLAAGSAAHRNNTGHSSATSPLPMNPGPPPPPGGRSAGFAQPARLSFAAKSTVTAQLPPPGGIDDQNNGLRIQTEMSRIFEGYTDLNNGRSKHARPAGHIGGPSPSPGANVFPAVTTPNDDASMDPLTPYSGNGSVYQHFRAMF
jgi:hypothetical protein